MNRRHFLIAAGLASGGFLVGCADSARQQLSDASLPLDKGQVALNGWVKVGPDGRVTVSMAHSEMGQGVHTGLLMLVIEELDCGWENIGFENAPIDRLYGNVAGMAEGVPFRADDDGLLARSARWTMLRVAQQLGLMMTGGSSSVRDLWPVLREAAAVTRETLIEAVASAKSLAPSVLTLESGHFLVDGKPVMSLGKAVQLLGASPTPAARWTLREPSDFRYIGKPMPRKDASTRLDGTAQFGIDVRRPGMLYAAIRFCPVRTAAVRSFEGGKAAAAPGVRGVITVPPLRGGTGGVAVVADRYWQARKALALVTLESEDVPMAAFSSAAAQTGLAQALDEEDGFTYWHKGDPDVELEKSARQLTAEYSVPWLAHTTLEPMNCTVEYHGDRATVWAPTQVPGMTRAVAAEALGLEPEQVELSVTLLGGGFGRRAEVDFVAQAATIARQFPGRPVQLLWSREDDVQHDFYRPACVSRFTAGLDGEGRIAAWRNISASQSIVPDFLARTFGMPGMGPDKTTSEGAFDQAYAFPHARVAHVVVDLPVPVGFWRAVGHSHQSFFVESFIDECAHAAGRDPLAYRLELLAEHPRERAVLELAAARAGWPQAREAGRALGLALHESFGTLVAQVAEVSRTEAGRIRVHRIVCAVDCGIPINPNLIAQQMESAVIYGLSAALGGRIDIENGQVQQGNFDDYPTLSLAECPVIETHLVQSAAPPGGIGEPGLPPVAPAVANAVFALTGTRLRTLPLAFPA